jgi:uncharacterized protein Yka (UPF0111/DUF47 family)
VIDWLSRLLPFASRTHPADAFVEQFRAIVSLAITATDQLALSLHGKPEQALEGINDIEHRADDVVRQVHRLVDRTFIPPYDKRDIVHLIQGLDNIVDGMRTAVRQVVGYRVHESPQCRPLCSLALEFRGVILRALNELKQVVEAMPAFEHDRVRASARAISLLEDEGDELLARAIQILFPDPNQPLTVAMLAWRAIFLQLEHVTDTCDHAMSIIVSVARQEGQ